LGDTGSDMIVVAVAEEIDEVRSVLVQYDLIVAEKMNIEKVPLEEFEYQGQLLILLGN
jgi:uncharacterized protein with ATP-grasp and redox domains